MLLIKYPQGSTDLKIISALKQYSDYHSKNIGTERVIEAMEIILSPLVIFMAGILKGVSKTTEHKVAETGAHMIQAGTDLHLQVGD